MSSTADTADQNSDRKPLSLLDLAGFDDPEPPTQDQIFDRFFQWVSSRGYKPWPHQQDAVLDLLTGSSVILGTPTGSGKSMVAQALMFDALATGKRGWYTAPIKALVSEKFFDFVSIFGKENVGMITGDSHINTDAPIICCTAEILANEALEGRSDEIDMVAMDEFHYFGDSERGWAWQVPLLTLPHTIFLLMSATLGDTSSIVKLLERQNDHDVNVIDDAPRPVPLSYKYVQTPIPQTIDELIHAGKSPIYVVHFSQAAAVTTAQMLSSYGVATREQRDAIKQVIHGFPFTTKFGQTLRHLLVTGVGVHHAGMLPRYRRLVEQLAQQGLLPVICGTDTLGVGINVPIHTVLMTALVKFDGNRERRLHAREFHQIAGRAGRSGFDSEGLVVCEAPDYEIENAKAFAKANGDPKKVRKIHKKGPEKGSISWDEQTFRKLIAAPPETLVPHLQITHSLVLNEIWQGGDAHARIDRLINESLQPDRQKRQLEQRADEIIGTLVSTGLVDREEHSDGSVDYSTTVDVPDNFALDEPLSPFLLAALELLDPASPSYDLDVISMVEATLEDPLPVLKAQQRQARDQAALKMRDEGVEYEDRVEKLQEITYPKPLNSLLSNAFSQYCADVPWARDYQLSPKSVVRDMVESASDFNGYIARYQISRSEGTLLRYLSDAYRVLSRTVPDDKKTDRIDDITDWLSVIVRGVDSSLVDEWEKAGQEENASSEQVSDLHAPGTDRNGIRDRHGLELLIRNALFRRVILISQQRDDLLGQIDSPWSMGRRAWSDTLDDIYDEHESILTDQEARSRDFFILDESQEKEGKWHVRQILDDSEGDHDWAIDGIVDIRATQDEGQIVFDGYRVATVQELLDSGDDISESVE
jgi:hypothetical protein